MPAILAMLAFLAVWELYVDLSGIKPSILPSPSRILMQGWLNRQTLLDNTWPTLGATLGGFALSLVFAFASSVLMDFVPFMRRALLPLFIVSQTLPLVAIAPLVVL